MGGSRDICFFVDVIGPAGDPSARISVLEVRRNSNRMKFIVLRVAVKCKLMIEFRWAIDYVYIEIYLFVVRRLHLQPVFVNGFV